MQYDKELIENGYKLSNKKYSSLDELDDAIDTLKWLSTSKFYNPSYNSTADDSEDDRRIDAEIFYNYFGKKDTFMMDVGLYVGTFDKNKPVKAKCYEDGCLVHDGKWRDFKEPVG